MGKRVLAFVIDALVLAALIWCIQQFVGFLFPEFASWRMNPDGQLALALSVTTVSLPIWLYFTLFESGSKNASPGKRALHLKVVRFGDRPITRSRAFLRTLIKLAPLEVTQTTFLLPTPLAVAGPEALGRAGFMFGTLFFGAWVALIFFSPHAQGVHDLLTGTLVIPDDENTPPLPEEDRATTSEDG